MFSRSAWLHLRIPFSYFLLPVFLFSVAISPNLNANALVWVLIILHGLLYPASNGFNSYFDKDEKSIGGLKNPPPVNRGLYYLSLSFDVLAVVLGYVFVNTVFAVMLFIYGLVSKAYSHPWIRLKKYPVTGWLTTGFFQGAFTFAMCYVGLNDFPLQTLTNAHVYFPAMLSSLVLWANYPMTQVYQHEEDKKRGDITLSLMLGVRGTFLFTAVFFALATALFVVYFYQFYTFNYAIAFLTTLTPVLLYFVMWFIKVRSDETKADFTHTMWLNMISATALNAFFIWFFLTNSQVLQVFFP